MRPRNQGSILLRLLTAAVLVPLLAALVWVPICAPLLLLFVTAFCAVGLWEFFAIARAKGIAVEASAGTAAGLAVMLVAYLGNPLALNAVFFAGVALMAWAHLLRGAWSLEGLAVSALGVLYVGWMPAHFVLIHRTPDIGAGLITLLCAAVMCSDGSAYFVGRAMGRHKLAARISPNKTWEGAIGGVAGAVLGVAILYALGRYAGLPGTPPWPLWVYAGAGAVLAVAGQVGDLVESMIKRDAGVKDSGNLLPGHGGVLDRCDGMLIATPCFYYMFRLLAP